MIVISYPDMFTIAGLFLDAIGIVLLFYFAPEKFPNPQSTAFFKLEDGSDEKWKDQQPTREKIALLSLGMIVLGFGLQALAVIVW